MSVEGVSLHFLGCGPIQYFGLDPIDPRSSLTLFSSIYFHEWSKVDIALNAKFWHFGASVCTRSVTGCLREPFNPDIFSYKTGELNLSLF